MKRLTVIETGIIGIFIGFIVAAYLTFLTSNDSFIGNILSWISFEPFTKNIPVPGNEQLVFSFIFYVILYTIYGLLIGFLIKKTNRPLVTSIVLILIATAAGTEQVIVSQQIPTISDTILTQATQTASVISALDKKNQQQETSPQHYFGVEAYGDLNGDGQNDIAFIIPRIESANNASSTKLIYYLAAAIATSTGHIGSNLLFLGEGIKPQNISINDGNIEIDYTKNTSATIKKIFAQLKNGTLEWLTGEPLVKPLI